MAKDGRKYEDINGKTGFKPTLRKRSSGSNGNGDPADWTTADAELIKRVVAACSRNGGAVRFGYTRDGGAYALGIYGDGDPFTEYLAPKEDVNEWLTGFALDYEK